MPRRRCSGLSTSISPPNDQNAWPPSDCSPSWSSRIILRPASTNSAVATRPASPTADDDHVGVHLLLPRVQAPLMRVAGQASIGCRCGEPLPGSFRPVHRPMMRAFIGTDTPALPLGSRSLPAGGRSRWRGAVRDPPHRRARRGIYRQKAAGNDTKHGGRAPEGRERITGSRQHQGASRRSLPSRSDSHKLLAAMARARPGRSNSVTSRYASTRQPPSQCYQPRRRQCGVVAAGSFGQAMSWLSALAKMTPPLQHRGAQRRLHGGGSYAAAAGLRPRAGQHVEVIMGSTFVVTPPRRCAP